MEIATYGLRIMVAKRIIARLDIKAPNLIKGIHLEGLRVIGNPAEYTESYYLQGIDELIYMDVVASLYGRNSIVHLIKNAAEKVFIPLTVGGGIRSITDVETMLRSGADKVAINTAAVKNKTLIREIAQHFGSQCMVLSVEAKSITNNHWEVYTENGRERTNLDVLDWCKEAEDLGAGEILLTSVDREGTRKGYDLALINAVSSKVNIPVIASGGCGSATHIVEAFQEGNADAVAVADILHYQRVKVIDLKTAISEAGINVRPS